MPWICRSKNAKKSATDERGKMNKAILIGNITKDLDLRKTQSNKSVLEFSVAINEGYGDRKYTEYINVVAWDGVADRIGSYCHKGSKVMIEGRIKTDSYEKNGQKIYKTFVVAYDVEFLSPKNVTPSEKQEQTLLTGSDRDVMGFNAKEDIKIEPEDLPFY